MSITLVLGVGLDPSLTRIQNPAWRSAGFYVTPVASIREAIDHFKNGDFDLVLLGHSLSDDCRERLTFLIRSLGSRVPVVCIAKFAGCFDTFADATLQGESNELLQGMGELMARSASTPKAGSARQAKAQPE